MEASQAFYGTVTRLEVGYPVLNGPDLATNFSKRGEVGSGQTTGLSATPIDSILEYLGFLNEV